MPPVNGTGFDGSSSDVWMLRHRSDAPRAWRARFSRGRVDDRLQTLNCARVKLRDARFADAELGTEGSELHAAEIVLRHDVALALWQLLEGLDQGLLSELGGDR